MLAWDAAQAEPVIVLFAVTVLYVAFHYGASPSFLRRWVTGEAPPVYFMRAAGFVLLGVIPAIISQAGLTGGLAPLGMRAGDPAIGLAFVAGTIVIVLPLLFLNARKPAMWAHYPMIRARKWDRALFVKNALSWVVYLFAYEFFFRGFLLMSMERWVGAWPAIAITTGLYVWAHIHKNAAETIGCIPMGVVFALAALVSGSVWPPFVMHTLIAVSSDYFAVRANPELCSA